MPGGTVVTQSFFLAVATISALIAGLFSLLLLMHSDGNPGRLTSWRIRMIVRLGLGTTIAALAVMAIAEFVDTENAFVRWATLAALMRYIPTPWVLRSLSDPEVFRNSQEKSLFQVFGLILLALAGLNLILASTGLLVTIFVIQVVDPISVVTAFTATLYVPPAEAATGSD